MDCCILSTVDLPVNVLTIKVGRFEIGALEAADIWTAPLFLHLTPTCSQHWDTKVFEVFWQVTSCPNIWNRPTIGSLICLVPHPPDSVSFSSSLIHRWPSRQHSLHARHALLDSWLKQKAFQSSQKTHSDRLRTVIPVYRQGEQQRWKDLWRSSGAWLSLQWCGHHNRQHR